MIRPQTKPHTPTPAPAGPVDLAAILTRERISLGLEVGSKKRLLESMSELLLHGTDLSATHVFHILTERERLGSTGVGNGIALPHGRVTELTRPIGAFARLARPIDFDALDNRPVTMVFGLLVPAEATQQHLQILARLATLFDDAAVRDALATARSVDEIYHLLTEEQR